MTINIDGLTAFYIIGALSLFSIALFAFIADRNGKSASKR